MNEAAINRKMGKIDFIKKTIDKTIGIEAYTEDALRLAVEVIATQR